MKNSQPIVLLTGVSSGIGLDAAQRLLDRGCEVWGACRREPAPLKGNFHWIPLDLTDGQSIEQCTSRFLNEAQRIDILVNNAGYGQYGPVEMVSIDDARRQMEVNLMGLAHLTQLLLPQMRKQGAGRIINIASMAGKVHTAYGAWYHAAKFALEGFSDCLRWELRPLGIRVILIEPGCIRTPWGTIASDHLRESTEGTAYAANAAKVARTMEKIYGSRWISHPSLIGKTIVRAALAAHPRTRYLTGFMARPSVLMRRLLPDRAFDYVLRLIEC
ncbi:MAG: SDR family NAD(P)-dependent oxidoreductase [Bacteroidaceae bacterium]|nr:SDR family NAD(P)-dependent oxidoreductase [Bacteroidaceae bacterium]